MNTIFKTLDHARKLFLRGLLMLLPLTITLALFSFTFRFIRSWLAPLRSVAPQTLQKIPFAEFLIVSGFILVIGFITQSFLIKKVWRFFEALLERIPLLRPVYFGIKQLIVALTQQEEESFQKIALIEFPRKGVYSIGFITCLVPAKLIPSDKTYYSAYLPTTPNPTTGYYIMAPEDECIILDITKQEAMSLIMSGGIVQPKHF